ncbi:hypothetical protein FRC02_009200 [Tulasnella sp. 418]|nr:hypothetical protein FRC02_009200 [Tulasnella sp. 418]
MSSPRAIVQIAILGAQILGRAFMAAGKQAVKNAQYRPGAAAGEEVAGLRNAASGSPTDILTREHRMTFDEAHLILNAKRGDPIDAIIKNYEALFKANSPPAPPAPETVRPGRAPPARFHSHYLQSKVVRARERIEAEMELLREAETKAPATAEAPTTPSPSQQAQSSSSGPSP